MEGKPLAITTHKQNSSSCFSFIKMYQIIFTGKKQLTFRVTMKNAIQWQTHSELLNNVAGEFNYINDVYSTNTVQTT